MPTRLENRLEETRRARRKAMGIFLTCGFPTIDATLSLLLAADRGGADFIELGMPFSDPLAEGVPIQRSSAVALANGVSLSTVLEIARLYRSASDTPLVLMGYANPVYRFGLERFCRLAADSGVDGLILPDLPPDEADEMKRVANAEGLDLIFLIAPNTPEDRIRMIDCATSAFVYAVAFAGLTGDPLDTGASLQGYLARASQIVSHPLLVGFGIKSAIDAATATRHADGFIVGSAVIRLIEALWNDPNKSEADRMEAVATFVRNLHPGTGK